MDSTAGLPDLVGFLSEVHAYGIDLFLHQQGVDTTTPAGKALFQMMGVFAEFERAMIQERVRAGLERAKAQGKTLARPVLRSPRRCRSAAVQKYSTRRRAAISAMTSALRLHLEGLAGSPTTTIGAQ